MISSLRLYTDIVSYKVSLNFGDCIHLAIWRSHLSPTHPSHDIPHVFIRLRSSNKTLVNPDALCDDSGTYVLILIETLHKNITQNEMTLNTWTLQNV